MDLSILIPTYNNINYLKLLCKSLKENSNFQHQLIFHINDGSDGSLEFIKKENYLFTHSKDNIGLCSSIKEASKLIKNDYVLYTHDDMYFCKDWDIFLKNEINKMQNKFFYLSGASVSYKDSYIHYDCGKSFENFNIKKFNDFCLVDNSPDYKASHYAPHVVHKDLWNKVDGFSLDFDPGDGSDPDFCMKLWLENVRIFKCVSKFKVYHFGSVTTRKKNVKLNKGTKKFLLKYGFNPKFFRKYYLKSDGVLKYAGPVTEPTFSFTFLIDIIINKLKYYYFKITWIN